MRKTKEKEISDVETKEIIPETVSEVSSEIEEVDSNDSIIVNDIKLETLQNKPLVVVLPPTASKAQVEFAKILNAYAYCHPEKWQKKKEYLLKVLENKKNEKDPISNPDVRLSVGTKPPIQLQ